MAENDLDARARMEAKKRTLMREVERALLDALAESSEVHRTLWRLQREGFTLQLFLDCQREEDPRRSARRPSARAGRRKPAAAAEAEPTFRIDADDLRFLRSLGIDPTRKRRARRSS
jgi:hypothetical protein